MTAKIKVVIIDDEAPARAILARFLQEFPQLEIEQQCSNGFEGLKAIQETHPDLIFLDIQMPKITGFEMLELLDEAPAIIFTTAYDQYALKAFDVNAIDYLLKPFSRERFHEAVNKAVKALGDPSKQQKALRKLKKHLEARGDYLERIVVTEGYKILIVPVQNIYWLEAQDDYVMLHTREGGFLKQQTMKYFEAHLDPSEFVRIHRSHIVKISTIKEIEVFSKESHRVRLANGQRLPVSKSGHARLRSILS
ncbi:MAG: LytR/AlgR family response regulator transcription factor [bacterium]